MLKKWILAGVYFAKTLKKKNISAFAASTAFFLFLSLIPALILLCGIIPYTPLTEANLMKVVTDIAPDTMDAMLIGMIAQVYDKLMSDVPYKKIADIILLISLYLG